MRVPQMSMTFMCPEAPEHDGPCYCKENGYDCDRFCPGTRKHSEAPEFDVAESNGFDLLHLVEVDPYLYVLRVDQLAAVQQRLFVIINSHRRRSHLVRPVEDCGGAGTGAARMITCGNTDEQTLRRLTSLQRLIAYAQKRGYSVEWY